MRIAIYGASGTGKTTLANTIVKRVGLPINPVGARSVARAMGYESPYGVDAAGRRAEFQRRLVIEKCDWERDHEAFVTDRTTFDNLVYTMLHDVHAIDEELLARVGEGFARYTHAVFCPISAFQNLGGDAARVADNVYHQLYEKVIVTLVSEALRDYPHVRHLTCDVGSAAERLAWVDRCIVEGDKMVCSVCGSDNVQHAFWVNPNTNEVFEEFGSWNEDDSTFCADCEETGVDLIPAREFGVAERGA